MASIISAGTTSGTSLNLSGDTSGVLELASNGSTTAVTINTSQGVAVLNCLGVGNATPSTSGAGITFPASQSASTDANTLDDYEEGDWTPTIGTISGTTGSPTYTSQVGRYIKVGRLVTVNVQFAFNKNTLSGGFIAYINGLPFTSANTASVLFTNWSGWFNPSGTSFINVLALVPQNQTRLDVYRMTTAGVDSAPLPISVAEMGTSISFYLTASYFSAN
jgi:hypothetical protein